MAKQLREYQLELVDAVWREICVSPSALAVLPTGGGKTVCIAELMRKSMAAKATMKIVMVMGRVDLVRQTDKVLCSEIGFEKVGVYCGSLNRKEKNKPITVCSIHSIKDQEIFADLLVIDEVHNLDQEAGSYSEFIAALQVKNPKIKIIGFTATPFRSNGFIYGEDLLFKKPAYRKTIREIIDMGFLVEPRMRGSKEAFDVSNLRIRGGEYRQEDVDNLVNDEEIVKAQVTDALTKSDSRMTVVWACANIEHCNMVANELMAQGQHATTVHSKLDKNVRDQNLSMFMGGMIRHMVFVSILSEGFDYPPIDTVVLMRPTRSPVLYIQTVGRGLRPFDNKVDCLVLDYGQVVRTLGPLDDPYIKGKKGEGEAPMKECPNCNTWVFAGVAKCPECDFDFPPREEPKLDKRADHESKILSEAKPPETLNIGKITAEMFTAKSGNQCVMLIYYEKSDGQSSILFGPIYNSGSVREFFVTTSAWAMERLEQRLNGINMDLPSMDFPGTIEVNGTFEIVKQQDGKYDRVIKAKCIAIDPPKVVEPKQEIITVEPSFQQTEKVYMDDGEEVPF